jgi:hypothetical protein
MDFRSFGGSEFDCVADEILKDLSQLTGNRRDVRQLIMGDLRPAFLNGVF